MSSAESWDLTPREFKERQKVRENYVAMLKVEIRNAPHFHRQDKKPWKVDDFLTPEKVTGIDKSATLFAQAELGLIQNRPDLVPDWAKGPYKRREKAVAIG